MNFFKKLLVSITLLVALAVPSLGQTYDQVGGATDPSTGNVHVSIPIFSRPLMGASLELNTHMFISGYIASKQWNGSFAKDLYNNYGIFPQAVAGIEYTTAPQIVIPGACNTSQAWNVIDPSGASHPLPTSFWDCIGGSGTQTHLPSSSMTTDGSAITVVTDGVSKITAVYDKSGNKYTSTPTIIAGVGTVYSWTKTFPSGDTQTRTYNTSNATWSWKDQSGTTFLTESHNAGTGHTPLDQYLYTDGSGNSQLLTVQYMKGTSGSSMSCSGVSEEFSNTSAYVPAYIILSHLGTTEAQTSLVWQLNGSAAMDGRLSEVTYPNGSYTKYVWGGLDCTTAVPLSLTVKTSPDGSTENWVNYASNRSATNLNNFQIATTNSTDGTVVLQNYASLSVVNAMLGAWPYQGQFVTETIVRQTGGGTLSDSITCYNGYGGGGNPGANCPAPATTPVYPITGTRTFQSHDAMPANVTNLVYDAFDTYGNRKVHQVYDWGTWGGGSLLTTENWNYDGTTSCGITPSTSHIYNRVCNASVTDGVSVNYRYSGFTYDAIGELTQSNVQLAGTQYLTTNYGAYAHGLPGTITTPAGTTSFTYAECGGLALTKTTFPVSAAGNTQQDWDCNGGVLKSTTDQNGNKVTFTHADPFYRLTKTIFPDDTTNDINTITYSSPSTFPPTVTATSALTPTTGITSTATFDGFGHVTQTATTDIVAGSGENNFVTMTYNGLGQLLTKTNPYWTNTDPTYGLFQYTYDSLGRVTTVEQPDSTFINIAFTGRDTHVTGLGGTDFYSEADGAGRTKYSCDVANSGTYGTFANNDTQITCSLSDLSVLGIRTSFLYNPAGDMLSAVMAGTGHSETKSYAVDLAGRVTGQTLPESGTDSWTYDSPLVGQMSTHTDARGITTTMLVDNLFRPTQLSFSDGTPTTSYNYDVMSPVHSNQIGRLAWVQTGTTNTFSDFSYDVMGRTSTVESCAPLGCSPWAPSTVSYTFDFAGNITSLADADTQNTLTYTRNANGELTNIAGGYTPTGGDDVPSSGGVLFDSGTLGTYNALGELVTYFDAGYITHHFTYDKMGRMLTNSTSGVPFGFGETLTYNNDGTIHTDVDGINGNWTYAYTKRGELKTATCNSGCAASLAWTYDEFGNRWSQSVTAGTGPQPNYSFDTHNHITSGVTYDAAGNMTNDGTNNYGFDALNRVKSINTTQFNYVFDALGNRVEASGSSVGNTLDYVYDGSSVLHTNTSTTLGRGLNVAGLGIYRGTPGSGAMTYWMHYRDKVGSLRAESKYDTVMSQIPKASWTNLPFGDALTQTGVGNGNIDDSIMFGDTFEDTTSGQGLINHTPAREMATIQGRWLSVDPAHSGWNGYVYANNDPVGSSDPSGLCTGCDDLPDNPQPNCGPAAGNGGSDCGGSPTQDNLFPGGTPDNPVQNQNLSGFELQQNFGSAQSDSQSIVNGANATGFWGGATGGPGSAFVSGIVSAFKSLAEANDVADHLGWGIYNTATTALCQPAGAGCFGMSLMAIEEGGAGGASLGGLNAGNQATLLTGDALKALPTELKMGIEAFKDMHPEYACAQPGMCVAATRQFNGMMNAMDASPIGTRANIFDFSLAGRKSLLYPNPFPAIYDPRIGGLHEITQYGEFGIDFTAHQYGYTAQWPVVLKLR